MEEFIILKDDLNVLNMNAEDVCVNGTLGATSVAAQLQEEHQNLDRTPDAKQLDTCSSISNKPANNDQGKCEVCGNIATSFCRNCCEAFYCCREHQKSDWKQHKRKCFPVKSVKGKQGYRELATTRDIEQGEIMLKVDPLLIFPLSKRPGQMTCVECCTPITDVNQVTQCSNCGWELCSIACNGGKHHRENECPIFSKDQGSKTFMVLNKVVRYYAIGIIRALLLKEKDQKSWTNIQEMDSFQEEIQARDEPLYNIKALVSFVQQDCQLKQFDEETVVQVFGILRGNSFDVAHYDSGLLSDRFKNAALLFPTATQIGPNCIPNARFSLEGRQSGNLKLFLLATVPIPRESIISTTFEIGITATFIRRVLKERFFFQKCTCERCVDPTELGTYISAVRCKICSDGYCIQINPTADDPPWECQNCHIILENQEMMPLMDQVTQLLQGTSNWQYNTEKVVNGMLKCISKLKEELLHPNHFMILNTEIDVCKRLVNICALNEIRGTEFSSQSFASVMVELGQHVLSIVDILSPGYSRLRGYLLYYIQFGLVNELLRCNKMKNTFGNTRKQKEGVERGRKKRIQECKQYQQEIQKIFEKDPEQSEEQFMLNTLKAHTGIDL